MRGFSKLGITLTSALSLLLLALLAEILYLLWRRRKVLRRTRVEPSAANHRQPLEALKLEAIDGPSSRVLFTIKEDDREELETEELPSLAVRKTKNVLPGETPEVVVVVDSEAEPPFLTPCASPAYYTPSSSPGRERK